MEKKTPQYSQLFWRAIKLSVEFAIMIVLLYYLPNIIQFIQLLYGLI